MLLIRREIMRVYAIIWRPYIGQSELASKASWGLSGKNAYEALVLTGFFENVREGLWTFWISIVRCNLCSPCCMDEVQKLYHYTTRKSEWSGLFETLDNALNHLIGCHKRLYWKKCGDNAWIVLIGCCKVLYWHNKYGRKH